MRTLAEMEAMKAKATPGPWAVRTDDADAGPADGFRPFGACGCCSSPWMNAGNKDTGQADAEVIACAPDAIDMAGRLARALAARLDVYEKSERYFDETGDTEGTCRMIADADAAARALLVEIGHTKDGD